MRAIALLALAAAPTGQPRIEGLVPIALHGGINRVPGFLPGGGAATIVEAWHANGNAHSYHVWMVLAGPTEDHPVGVVVLDEPSGTRDVVSDDPFDGERVLGRTFFARGRVGGAAASVLVIAHLEYEAGKPLADHNRATVRVYRLEAATFESEGAFAFRPVATLRSGKRYCNVDLAVRDLLGVPLPADFAGANRTDGCW